ncbi:bladder cancer-related protein BC10-domain-containing protein [Mariannaea sp. PMI_226]|nr:bladder cancer-related protein BC10-domain-containing protein [Mariannaea sp. PMI_226]
MWRISAQSPTFGFGIPFPTSIRPGSSSTNTFLSLLYAVIYNHHEVGLCITMFCLRSWLPLLFLPTNASPAFILLFFICTYFLNRPCHYCSILLLILFLTSCNWSDRCFFDFGSDWFLPRPLPSHPNDIMPDPVGFFNESVVEMINTTASAFANAALEAAAERKPEWTGLGLEWLRSLLGKREWRIDCMDIYVRL